MSPTTMQRYARFAGVLMLLSIIFGALGEAYLPGKYIVSGDAAATAANILGKPLLFRLSWASYLVEGLCDVALCVVFYVLLKPVDKNLALLSAFFGIASMITFAVAQGSIFSASVILRDTGGMNAFSVDQRNALALLAIRIASTVAGLFLCLYGTASMLRGFLIARSGYLPKVIGILMFIGGAGFFLRSTTYLLAPQFSSPLMLLPMALGGVPLMAWLLFKGVDTTRLPSEGLWH
jgi:hypothetical protein